MTFKLPSSLALCLVFALQSAFSHSLRAEALTPAELERLVQERDKIRSNTRRLKTRYSGSDNFVHAALVARLAKSNVFLFGPPGGGKSAFVDDVIELDHSADDQSYFKIQLHQMMSEHAFVGTQGLDTLKSGEFNINTNGTVAGYRLALVDELDKGNPAVLASLLNLLNEREIWAGNKVIKAKTETIFTTSNTNLLEFYQIFVRRGEGATALALLNRFQFKLFVYNWLSEEAQQDIDAMSFAFFTDHQDCDAKEEDLLTELVSDTAVDWDFLRAMAKKIFTLDPMTPVAYRKTMSHMRKIIVEKIKKDEKYIPSVEFSERLRQQIPFLMVYSSLVDFLLSPLADTVHLESYTTQGLPLCENSVWRAHLALTTLTSGKTMFSEAELSTQKPVLFPSMMSNSPLRDAREEATFATIAFDQWAFNQAFSTVLTEMRAHEQKVIGKLVAPIEKVSCFEDLLALDDKK